MEYSRPVRRAIKWCSFFTSVAVLALSPGCAGTDSQAKAADAEQTAPDVQQRDNRFTPTQNDPTQRLLMLVSTLDGHVTALDGHSGHEEWHVAVGDATLLSSSISKLRINKNGLLTHLIPSLDGGLYQFDGEVIEPVPLAADILLSSSFRFNDDSMVVGGKETESYGVDVNTGKVQYICTMEGCTYLDGSEGLDPETAGLRVEEKDILVISRHTKTIRAVEMKNGLEKWNFSVGQHEIAYMKGNSNRELITEEHKHSNDAPNDVPFDSSGIKVEEEEFDEGDQDYYDFPWMKQSHLRSEDIQLKVIVPQGLVVALDKKDNDEIIWQHKFPTPIAGAWVVEGGEVVEVSLFDAEHNFALEEEVTDEEMEGSGLVEEKDPIPSSPLLYVGIHDGQPYVQPSVQMITDVEYVTAQNLQPNRITSHVDMPRVQWKPYLATAASRTPAAIQSRNPLQIGWQKLGPMSDWDADSGPSSVALWHEEYPYDGGFYLYPEPIRLPVVDGGDGGDNGSCLDDLISVQIDTITVSLLNWWREVLAISVVFSILMNLFVHRYIYKKPLPCMDHPNSKSEDNSTNEEVMNFTKPSVQMPAFTSRYETDFDQVSCLGKGGFGVVFQAKNKMDDCDYAVKRIALNNSDRAKEKVMREVKALAKLEHGGIVRYYQAWFESPPVGWQEDRDRFCLDMQSSGTPTPSVIHTDNYSEVIKKQPRSSQSIIPSSFNPLQPFGDFASMESHLSDIEETFEEGNVSESLPRSGSEGFKPVIKNIDDSGSVCLGLSSMLNGNSEEDSSFDISFRNSFSGSQGNLLPFKDYNKSIHSGGDNTNKSWDVIFEDSGCSEITKPVIPQSKGDSVVDIPHSECSSVIWDTTETEDEAKRAECKNQRPDSLDIVKETQSRSSSSPASRLYLYIQMQLCHTDSLKDWLCNNTLSRDRHQCLDYFHQILSAVDYVHHCGLMHRDLKPSNIFFSLDGTVKVGDFGLVTAEEENFDSTPLDERSRGKASSQKHTDQVGTELYMSPEQCAGKPYTQKVDIFAMGMIFFELFYPFGTQMERTKTLLELKKLMFPSRFMKELPEQFSFVKPLLSHDAPKRPSSRELLQSHLLTDYEEARQAYSRIRLTSRSRTTSNSSSGSSG